jgi:peptide deformylase
MAKIRAMAILKVARLGHPVLREKCRDLSPKEIRSPEVKRLVQDMFDTMDEYGGVGLAAPQVHEPVRLAVIAFEEENDRYEVKKPQGPLVVFNARVSVLDDERSGFWEGCLSVPGMRGYVERPRKVRVDYVDENAEKRSLEAEGFLATVLQHELDHLDGVLYVDRIADPKKFGFTEEVGRHLMRAEDEQLDEDEG